MPPMPLRQPTPRERRLSLTFWGLARGTGVLTSSTEPIDIARHAIAAIDALEGSRVEPDIAADALSFLLQLEKTPHYASPEQTRGGEKDRHALVYSIGVLIFERLTGHHPFVESLSPIQAAAIRDRCSARGAWPHAGRGGANASAPVVGPNNLCSIPGELRGLLHRAMSPFPEDRWDGVQTLRQALARFVEHAERADRESASPPILLHRPSRDDSSTARPRRWPRATPPPCPGSLARRMLEERAKLVTKLPLVAPRTPAPERIGDPMSTARRRLVRPTTPPPVRAATPTPDRPRTTPPPTPIARSRSASSASPLPIKIVPPAPPAPVPAPRAATPVFAGEIDLDIDLRGNLRRRAVGTVFVVSMAAAVLLMAGHAMNRPGTAAAAQPQSKARAAVAAIAPTPTLSAPIVAPTPIAEVDIEPAVAEAEPPPFDPDLGGQSALERARDCFAETRLAHTVELGFSLRFSHIDGLSNRVYYPSDQPLARAERRCLDERLIGVTAGAPPTETTIVTYSLWITADGGRQSARVR